MAFRFPFTNLQELNLDWILEQVKQFSELIIPMRHLVETSDSALDNAQRALDVANETAVSPHKKLLLKLSLQTNLQTMLSPRLKL